MRTLLQFFDQHTQVVSNFKTPLREFVDTGAFQLSVASQMNTSRAAEQGSFYVVSVIALLIKNGRVIKCRIGSIPNAHSKPVSAEYWRGFTDTYVLIP